MGKFTIFLCFLLLGQGFGLEIDRLTNTTLKDEGAKIVGGQPISISDAPYQVLLLEDLGNNRASICGGSIISTDFILTAAHCTYGTSPRKWTVYAGSNVFQGGETHSVARITNHPRYVKTGDDFDFALMQLATKIVLRARAKEIIKLPAANDKIAVGAQSFVSGWGDVKDGGPSSDILRGVTVFYIKQSECKKSYPQMTNQMICAGVKNGGKDSCQLSIPKFGDSGGPLRRESDKKLIGVVSFGNGCARPKYPGVYARVAAVRSWIRSISKV